MAKSDLKVLGLAVTPHSIDLVLTCLSDSWCLDLTTLAWTNQIINKYKIIMYFSCYEKEKKKNINN
jgi:hypothetical protein